MKNLIITLLFFAAFNATAQQVAAENLVLYDEAMSIKKFNDSLNNSRTVIAAISKAQKAKLQSLLDDELEALNYQIEFSNYSCLMLIDSLKSITANNPIFVSKPKNTSDFYSLLADYKKIGSISQIHTVRSTIPADLASKSAGDQKIILTEYITAETNYTAILSNNIAEISKRNDKIKQQLEVSNSKITEYTNLGIEFLNYYKTLLEEKTTLMKGRSTIMTKSGTSSSTSNYNLQSETFLPNRSSSDTTINGISVIDIVEKDAEYPGGQAAMAQFLQKNLQYPHFALDYGIGGRVYLRFVISQEGYVSNVYVTRGIPLCEECGNEAIRVIQLMPKWTPGENNGKPVNMWYNLPIKFTP